MSPTSFISTTVGPHEFNEFAFDEFENPAGRRPPPINRSYPRWRQMESDMKRYYEKCRSTPKGRGPHGKEYCARTAWMILRKAGRYRDYPAFRRRAEHRPYAVTPSHRRRAAEEMVLHESGVFENPALFENPLSQGAKVAIGVGVVAALGVGAYFLFFNKPAAAATPSTPALSGASYNDANAISALLGAPGAALKVPVGSSVRAENTGSLWLTPGVTTSDATVLAPSVPGTASGFVAIKAGTATLTGSYTDPNTQQPVTGTITITVA